MARSLVAVGDIDGFFIRPMITLGKNTMKLYQTGLTQYNEILTRPFLKDTQNRADKQSSNFTDLVYNGCWSLL